MIPSHTLAGKVRTTDVTRPPDCYKATDTLYVPDCSCSLMVNNLKLEVPCTKGTELPSCGWQSEPPRLVELAWLRPKVSQRCRLPLSTAGTNTISGASGMHVEMAPLTLNGVGCHLVSADTTSTCEALYRGFHKPYARLINNPMTPTT